MPDLWHRWGCLRQAKSVSHSPDSIFLNDGSSIIIESPLHLKTLSCY